MSGYGILTFTNGDCYEGEFKDGVINGHGVWINGNLWYEGDFIDGQPEGSGEISNINNKNVLFKG